MEERGWERLPISEIFDIRTNTENSGNQELNKRNRCNRKYMVYGNRENEHI